MGKLFPEDVSDEEVTEWTHTLPDEWYQSKYGYDYPEWVGPKEYERYHKKKLPKGKILFKQIWFPKTPKAYGELLTMIAKERKKASMKGVLFSGHNGFSKTPFRI